MLKENKNPSFAGLMTFVLGFLLFAVPCASAQNKSAPSEQERYKHAADYSKKFRGLSFLIIKGDKVVFEEYQNGHTAETPWMLASGTKSFAAYWQSPRTKTNF
jgi:CubicO group peptidase (beta-lactamase class C family)